MQSTISSQQPVVVCGTEGSDEGSLVRAILSYYDEFIYPVMHTTVPQHETPVKCVHVTLNNFLKLMAEDKFVKTTRIDDKDWVGLSIEAILVAANTPNRRCIVILDTKGVKSLKEHCPDFDALYVFVAPPSPEDVESRLKSSRLAQFKEALSYAKSGAYDAVIVNRNRTKASMTLYDIANGRTNGDVFLDPYCV